MRARCGGLRRARPSSTQAATRIGIALPLHQGISQFADPFDCSDQNRSGSQETVGCACATDAGRRTGEDQISGQHGADSAEMCSTSSGMEKIRSLVRPLLEHFVIKETADFKVVDGSDLVQGDDRGPDRPESRVGLSEAELWCWTGELHAPLGKVLPHRQTGDMRPRIGCLDVARRCADDCDEFSLPDRRRPKEA